MLYQPQDLGSIHPPDTTGSQKGGPLALSQEQERGL